MEKIPNVQKEAPRVESLALLFVGLLRAVF
jgi:hypothetical protein